MVGKVWTPAWDLSTIPDALLASEAGRRNNARRKKRSGGTVWSAHREDYSRCRCAKCTENRGQSRVTQYFR